VPFARDGGRQLLCAGANGTPTPGNAVGERQPSLAAIAPWPRCGRHVLLRGLPGPGSTGPSLGGPGSGVASAWRLRAATSASRHCHGWLRIGRCRLSSSPLPATADPALPPAARCRAPGTASRRGCRTAARGCGTPDSGGRRSAECTDGGRRASASNYICGRCQSPSRAGWRSPLAGGSSGRSPGVTALAWLSGSDQPPSRQAWPSRSRIVLIHRTLRWSGLPGTIWVPPATSGTDGCGPLGLQPGRRLRGRAAAARPCDCAHEHMHHGRPPRRAGALAAGGPELGRPPLRRPCRGPLGSAAAGSCVLCRCRTRPGSPPHRRCGSGRCPRSARSLWGLDLGRR
jgi:hypothetical protein